LRLATRNRALNATEKRRMTLPADHRRFQTAESPAFVSDPLSDSLQGYYDAELLRADDADDRAAEPAPEPRVTERPNPLTANIDAANAEGIVRLLRQCDAQVVNGYQDFIAIADRQMLAALAEAAERIVEILDRPGRSRVIFAGAGTSGRVAMMAAAMVNNVMGRRRRPRQAAFAIPGGEAAFVVAQENAEDSPDLGVSDLKNALKGAKNLVYIGVTCGLSAPYVMGQVDFLRDRPDTLAILIGFTSPATARSTRVEGWDKTCAQVVAELAQDPRHMLLTPVIGPEAIAGSTRLKGAAATNILIQMLTFWSFAKSGVLTAEEEMSFCPEGRALDAMRRIIHQYEDARTITYLQSDHLAALIQRAGQALRAGRHLYYLGTGRYGALGLMDAAECPPTFGASLDQTRGFVEEGWSALDVKKAPQAPDKAREPYYRIDYDDFERDILPTLIEGDVVVGLGEGSLSNATRRLLGLARGRGASTGAIVPMPLRDAPREEVDVFAPLPLWRAGVTADDRCYAEMAVKMALNCISTGSYILAGKVYGNRMIDLKITNSKLFERAERLIGELLGVSRRAASAALISAIRETDSIGPAELSAPPREHCAIAAKKSRVVPTAMLLATGRYSLEEAQQALDADPIARNLVGRFAKPAANR
jgi:N-acetylmuramic acid 6-phosphate (MurNAc-6-P) etherase